MRPEGVGVVGLGAVGGSVAWGAMEAGIPVTGFSRLPADGVAAARAGAVRRVALSLEDLARDAELIVLCAPPAANLELLERLAPVMQTRDVLVTDVTSVKAPIMRTARRLQLDRWFAGAHPLAGTHESGFDAATPDRMTGALVYVTPMGADDATAREIADFWESVYGASIVFIDEEEHDRRVAWTSHLPQTISSALAVALGRHGPKGAAWGAGARDVTRLAAGNVEMWSAILRDNREPVLAALDTVEGALAELRRALEDDDSEELRRWWEEGVAFRRRMTP